MYTAFYGLREKPFALSPDPRYLYLAESHREALAHLLYGIDEGEGFIAVTGEVGTGKTTLCRTLLERLGPSTDVAYVFDPTLSGAELMQAINTELGLAVDGRSRRELHEQLDHHLVARRREGRRVLLLVDEAQNLAPETLEQIRLLSNLETDTQKLLQIVLIGQPELDAKLSSPELRQLRQRIGVHWRLGPLAPGETREYVHHRLRVAAGAERDLFRPAALREVHRLSAGLPRVINLLCDRALLAGYAARTPAIGRSEVRAAWREVRGPQLRARRAGRWRWVTAAGLLAALAAAAFAWTRGAPERSAPAPVAEALPPAPAAPPEAAPAAAPESPPIQEIAPPAPEPAAALDAWLAALPSDARADQALVALGAGAPGAFVHEVVSSTADLAALRARNRPALIALRAPDASERRVLLRQLADGRAVLAAVPPAEGEIETDAGLLQARWTGAAHVVWRDFEALPELVGPGQSGPAVDWLQRALAGLGFYAGDFSGLFDEKTYVGVIAFQRSQHLPADGVVGPLTKMALYDALGRYPGERLAEGQPG